VKISPLKIGPLKIDLSKIGPAKIGPAKIGPLETGPFSNCALKGFLDVSNANAGIDDLSSAISYLYLSAS
jgi:hypothetical protein